MSQSSLWLPDGRVDRTYVPDYAGIVSAYTKWFHHDFLGGIRGMTPAEVGIYAILLNEMYARGVALDISQARLARLCCCPPGSFKTILADLIESGKIVQLDCGYWNERVERAFIGLRSIVDTNSRAGKLSGEKRRKNSGPSERALNARSTNAEPSQISDKTEVESLPTSETLQTDDDAHARVDPSKGPEWLDPKRRTFREKLLVAMGVDPSGLNANGQVIGRSADMDEVQLWFGLGLTETEQIAVVLDQMSRKRDGSPPRSFSYFTDEMRAKAGRKERKLTPLDAPDHRALRGPPDRDRSYLNEPLFPRTAGGKP